MGKKKSLHSAINFTRGQAWAHYIKSMRTNGEQMEGMLHSAMQTEVDLTRFEAAVAAHGGAITSVVVTEEWCGDTLGVLPLLAKISQGIDGFHVTVFRGSEETELNQLLESEGMDRFPKVLFFDSDGTEIARTMERGKAAGAEFDAAVEEFGNPDDLMGATDPETQQKNMELLGKIGQRMQEAHERHVWRDTAEEWSQLLA